MQVTAVMDVIAGILGRKRTTLVKRTLRLMSSQAGKGAMRTRMHFH